MRSKGDNGMSIGARRLRFEHASLGTIGVGIVVLYAMVLLTDPSVRRFTAEPMAVPTISQSFGEPRVEDAAFGTVRNAMAPTGSVATLADLFHHVDYRLEGVRLGEMAVPRVLVDKVPADLTKIESVAERKRLFIQLALPLILYVNEKILADRERLIGLRDEFLRSGTVADARDRAWLYRLARRYGLETPDIDALLRRVDMIPPSLALAQGAEESGWGTSRFVREGNAIFGQRTFDKGAGLVPRRRDVGKTHEVKAFNGLVESVASYMINLNTHFAYGKFRRVREQQRASLGYMDAHALAGALDRYSERGEAYIATIRSIIDSNGLRAYDRARLSDDEALARIEPNV